MKTLVVVVGILALLGLYLSWTAGRLDRLHSRVEAARAALDAQLLRRSSVTLELATSGLLDPATSLLLADAGHAARAALPDDQEMAESTLTAALVAAFDQGEQVELLNRRPGGDQLTRELAGACRRVQMARRFHNDAVRAARAVHRQRLVRLARLAGRARMPSTFEIDDSLPAGLGR